MFAYCEFYGKWSIVQRRSLAELRATEDAELKDAQATKAFALVDEASRAKELIRDSRFTDHL